jgi:archaellum component FlaC
MSEVSNESLYEYFYAKNKLEEMSIDELITIIRTKTIENLRLNDEYSKLDSQERDARVEVKKLKEELKSLRVDVKVLIRTFNSFFNKNEQEVSYLKDLVDRIDI